ncbi:leucine-rich repeat domain-containing protein [Treponema pedis]|uniref:leucine-rich repeat domain-containing protein n=1 Tax=Treponema pedis TaxID=409322 RepID=UPI003D220429
MTKSKVTTGLALIVLSAAAVLFTGCRNTAGGKPADGAGSGGGGGVLLDTAVLTLSPDKLDIKVKAVTADGSPVTVEGCTETELPSDTETELHAQGTRVTLKGKITELHCGSNQLTALDVQGLSALEWLDCSGNQLTALNVQGLTALQGLDCSDNQLTALNVQGLTALQGLGCGGNQLTALNVQGLTALQGLGCNGNQLTALNVQGLTALQELDCSGNKLNAAAFEQLFTGLPQREESDNAKCILYTENPGVSEGNHTDFTAPSGLAEAFNTAKTVKKWKMYKVDAIGNKVEI